MTVSTIKPIFQQKFEYADLDYFSNIIYPHLNAIANVMPDIDMDHIVDGEFTIIVNWKKK